jgi:hypothetical protein
MNTPQYKGDIQYYIVKIEDFNSLVGLWGIVWQQAQHTRLDEGINDPIFFSEITPYDNAEYELLLTQVSCTYMRHLQGNHLHNDHKPKDKMSNKRKGDDVGDVKGIQGTKNFERGFDSKKPRMEKKSTKPVNADQGEALKGIRKSLLETGAKYKECTCCGSFDHQWVFWKNAIKIFSSKKKDKKPKKETSTPEVSTTSLKVKPRSLADQITQPAAASSSQVLSAGWLWRYGNWRLKWVSFVFPVFYGIVVFSMGFGPTDTSGFWIYGYRHSYFFGITWI